MDRPVENLVEEALEAINRGRVSLEACPDYFGAQWDKQVESEVRLALRLQSAGRTFQAQLPPPNLEAIWSKIAPELVKSAPAPSADSGSNPGLYAGPLAPVVVKAPPVKKPVHLIGWRRKPLALVASLLIFCLVSFCGTAGLAYASDPGDALYGMKLWLDGSEQLLAGKPQEKAQAALNYADRRLQEIERLVKKNRPDLIEQPASEYKKALGTFRQAAGPRLEQPQIAVLEQQRIRLTGVAQQLISSANGQAGQKLVKPIATLQEVIQIIDLTEKQARPLDPANNPSLKPNLGQTALASAGSPLPVTPSPIATATTGATFTPVVIAVTTPRVEATAAPALPEPREKKKDTPSDTATPTATASPVPTTPAVPAVERPVRAERTRVVQPLENPLPVETVEAAKEEKTNAPGPDESSGPVQPPPNPVKTAQPAQPAVPAQPAQPATSPKTSPKTTVVPAVPATSAVPPPAATTPAVTPTPTPTTAPPSPSPTPTSSSGAVRANPGSPGGGATPAVPPTRRPDTPKPTDTPKPGDQPKSKNKP